MPAADHRVPDHDQRKETEGSGELQEQRGSSHQLVAEHIRPLEISDAVQDDSGTADPQIPISGGHVQLSILAVAGKRQPIEHPGRRVAGRDLRVLQLEGAEHEPRAVPFGVRPLGRDPCDRTTRVCADSVRHSLGRFGGSEPPFADPVVCRIAGQEEQGCGAFVLISIHPRIITIVVPGWKGRPERLWTKSGVRWDCGCE